ncbi:HK97 family phage prohead protease [Zhengella mangrovi]|uniref:HK97 family phage prohead protease n=1 Tax=Zhengella mangrovi TaxID=1982044 RepID=A0A2G1QT18_9HYPH|nr:HK97 family phage prohead protease [Zhengella mangrovi]PHP68358.1 HK97 family phage prohead protease [Zhengella mangrovi]
MQAIDLEKKYAPVSLDGVDADGTFSGYASLFGEIDLGNDMVERGAFARSLRSRGAGGVRMLFQHDPALPIGCWSDLREDDRGLFVRGRLSAASARAREVLGLMRDGAVDGLSIGFRTVRARKGEGGVRRILEADLWEISVVTFPMQPGARIGEVKHAGALPTTRQFERWLTRDAGLTRSQARTVIVKGFGELVRERDAARNTPEGLAGAIRRAAETFSLRT